MKPDTLTPETLTLNLDRERERERERDQADAADEARTRWVDGFEALRLEFVEIGGDAPKELIDERLFFYKGGHGLIFIPRRLTGVQDQHNKIRSGS